MTKSVGGKHYFPSGHSVPSKTGNEHITQSPWLLQHAFLDDDWSLDMLVLLRDSVHHRNQGDIGPDVRMKMEKRLDELLARPPIYTKTDGSDTELDNIKKGIAKHRDYIITFLTNPAVPPTNNDSEKALRPAKTKLKVSGCFRTEAGAQKLRHRRLRHTDCGQERAEPLRGPSGHSNPCSGVAS